MWLAEKSSSSVFWGPKPRQGAAIADGQWLELHDLQTTDQLGVSREVAVQFGIRSALCCPLKIGKQVLGYLNHFASEDKPFDQLERQMVRLLAYRATATLDASNREHSLSRFEQLSGILQRVDEARTVEDVLEVMLAGALKLTGVTRGWVGRLSRALGSLARATHAGTRRFGRSIRTKA